MNWDNSQLVVGVSPMLDRHYFTLHCSEIDYEKDMALCGDCYGWHFLGGDFFFLLLLLLCWLVAFEYFDVLWIERIELW
jgi:hypothetical protein